MTPIHARFQVQRSNFKLHVELNFPEQGVSALFGASGSGKTTCLRAMAGLEKLPNSYFSVGDEVWQDSENDIFIPAHQRDIGYVFQEASLFEHLNVRDNLNFGRRRLPAKKRKVGFNSICNILSINTLLDRPPWSLSGGERQRVAIARALLTSPKLLLMDEPLSALDHNLKQEVLPYLERLQQKLSIPIIYVSHSADEVARLCDYIAIIKEGLLIKSGPLEEVMLDTTTGINFYDGYSSVLHAEVIKHTQDYLTELALTDTLTLRSPQIERPMHSQIRCRINAKDVSLCLDPPSNTSITNILAGSVTEVGHSENLGERIITVQVSPNHFLLAAITYASYKRLNLKLGSPVWAQIKSVVIL